MAADRQQAESQLHHLRGTRAVYDGIEITLARGLAELLRNICRRLALVADDVIGPVFLGDDELVGIVIESDDRRAAPLGAQRTGRHTRLIRRRRKLQAPDWGRVRRHRGAS